MSGISAINLKNVAPQDTQNVERTNVQFKANSPKSLERVPEADSFEKKGLSAGAKAAIGTGIAVGVFALGDVVLNHGKCLKKIFGMAERAAKPDANPPTTNLQDEGQKLYETYKSKLNGKTKVNVKEGKSNELAELARFYETQSTSAKNKALREGKILEYTIKDDGNIIKVKNGKIVSYKNANGEDLLHTFEDIPKKEETLRQRWISVSKDDSIIEAEKEKLLAQIEERQEKLRKSPDNVYLDKIKGVMYKIKDKDKKALAKIDDVVIEGYEHVISADDVSRYVKNPNTPTHREVYSCGTTKESFRQADDSWGNITKDAKGRKTEAFIGREGGSCVTKSYGDDYSAGFSPEKRVVMQRSYKIGNDEYKYVRHTADGKVEILQRCDANGKPLAIVEEVTPNGHKWKECYWSEIDDRGLYLRQIRDTKDKGKILSEEIVRTDGWIFSNDRQLVKKIK